MEGQRLALILVTFNRKEYLHQILSRIQSFSWNYSRFVIVNNSSSDGTSKVLLDFREPLGLEIISLPENIGHGAGLAQGLRKLQETGERPETVVFLEDDSIPQAGYLDFLVLAMQKHSFTLISSEGYLVRLGKRINLAPKEGEIQEADFGLFDGAIAKFEDLMIVGYPVEDWFMMFDDFEYCYRIRKAGFRIGVMQNPHVEILHEGWGGGNSKSTLWRSYYQSRNFILFVRRHFTLFNILDCILLLGKRLIGGMIHSETRNQTKFKIKGILDGVKGLTGKSLDPVTFKSK